MSAVLSQSDIDTALQELPGWARRDRAIERVLKLADFAAAMKLVNAVAAAAEAANHHPDIVINYNVVTLTLISHDSGGVTQHDLRMAEKINGIVGL